MLWIFAQMQLSLPKFAQVPGLKFFQINGLAEVKMGFQES